MTVLVLNCGSSSLKFQVVAPGPPPVRRARGVVERIGGGAQADFEGEGRRPRRGPLPAADHAAAVRAALAWLAGGAGPEGPEPPVPFEAVGHRVVHGGPQFTGPALLDDRVVQAIEALEELAPLHNAPSLAGIREARAALGRRVPMVAVFDTAFHAGLPEHAARYAIPHDLALRHGIRRYGFHGTSYRSVLARYEDLTGRAAGDVDLVALHLGSGCSAAAIAGGRPVDTSMGFTPLEGLVMATRAGDLDPAVVGHLARKEGAGVEQVERWLNERSGLLGLSGRSADMRELLAREDADPRARLAVEVFCYRARKYVGAYPAALGGAEALVFTGGIGERAPEIRRRICRGLEWCGLALDPVRNAAAVGREVRVSADGSRIAVRVIPTDEELVIARDTVAALSGEAA